MQATWKGKNACQQQMAHLLQVEASRIVIHPYVTIFVIYIFVLKDLHYMRIKMRLISIFSIPFYLVTEVVLGEREELNFVRKILTELLI
jgi:hypothetical protein